MGEWLAINVLLPIMYTIVDIGLFVGTILLIIMLIEKIKERI